MLIGKINKHFTKNIENKEQLETLAYKMREEHHLDGNNGNKKVDLKTDAPDGEASFSAEKNKVVVGKDKSSALFHEIGHAVEENNTKFFKFLQKGRGNYTVLALALYALMSQNKKPQYDTYENQNQGIGDKFKKYLNKSNALIPLLAFSPELITEAKASCVGLKFLKDKVKAKEIEKSLYKNIKHSYMACFGTYLFIPVSIMLMDWLQNGIENKIQQRRHY